MAKKTHGGKREGGGRPKSTRPIKKVTVNLYKDQFPITGEEIRAAIDQYQAPKSEDEKIWEGVRATIDELNK